MFATYMYAKTEAFHPSQQKAALMAKALSHPARIAILTLLAKRVSCYSGDIAGEIPLNRATVSQHLQELRKAGLLKGTIEGVHMCYCLDPDGIAALREQLSELATILDSFLPNHLQPSCTLP
jgi:DNA-binding transcriptional ArsR family regulator